MNTQLNEFDQNRRPGRAITGMAAILLPFDQEGKIDETAYQSLIQETLEAGLTPAVNMDTGYINLLENHERQRILELAKETCRNRPFLAGAYIEQTEGDVVDLYRQEMTQIVQHGGTPILFQTSKTHQLPPKEKATIYAEAANGFEAVYAFELGEMFAPNGEIWDVETFERILAIPEIKGLKHSSLNRHLELQRLQIRDKTRPDFKILTGNDLGIDMIEYGSDYLLGLAAFAPAIFSERDRYWQTQDARYLELADALQFLGTVAFRPPVPAYKHSAAVFLHLTGKIPTPNPHPKAAQRPNWEPEILAECARRLGL